MECAECGAPSETERDYTMLSTGRGDSNAIAVMRKVRCVTGHRYDEITDYIEEPTMVSNKGGGMLDSTV